MINTILTTFLATALLVSPISAPQKPPQQTSLVRNLPDGTFAGHIVQPGEYLMSIAKDYYGDEDYWTNIWNDNTWIADSANLESNWVLKIRKEKTKNPEELKSELAERIAQEAPVPTEEVPQVQAAAINMPVIPTQVVAAPVATSNAPHSLTDEQINYLGSCEAGMNPARNSGNGYYGAFQFSYGTWKSMGTGYERADLAPIDVQKAAVQRLVARSSVFSQFPGCSRKMRSAGMI